MRLIWVLRLVLIGLVGTILVAGHLRLQRLDQDTDADGLPDCTERAGMRSEEGDLGPTDPERADTDGDQVPDGAEVGLVRDSWWSCQPGTATALADPASADTDGDLLSDAYELSAGSDAFAGDTDGDGLSDGRERGWGSDPNVADTDGDGIRDGEDVTYGLTPVFTDDRIPPDSWADEFRDGLVNGDVEAEVDTIPQLLGALSGGAVSSVPVIGWIAGGVADSRDAAANAIRGDWISAGSSAAGLVPVVGDAVRASGLLTRFLVRYPDRLNMVIKAIANLEQVPASVRIKLLKVADADGLEQAQRQGLTDEQIIKLVGRGVSPKAIARGIATAAGVRTIEAANADTDGFVTAFTGAQAALTTRAQAVDGVDNILEGPVYINLPDEFSGGRLVDVCTACLPRPSPERSTLRFVKVGTQIYSETLQREIDKDAYLVDRGYGVEWHFFAGRTGLLVDESLIEALGQAGVQYYLHLPA